jgi:hypothetical protein
MADVVMADGVVGDAIVSHLIWNQKDCIDIDENAPVERALDIMVCTLTLFVAATTTLFMLLLC